MLLMSMALCAMAESEAEPWVVGAGEGVTTPRFLGIEGQGTRVAFVVDLSDSMLEPLTVAEREDLKRPVTGGGGGSRVRGRGDADGEDDADGQADADDQPLDLPWSKIETRFDAAREALELSLRQLGPGMHFSVIVFGTEAKPLLDARLVPASPRNVEAAIQALRQIRAGKPAANRAHGTLRGFTNLHGGLRQAFRLTEKAPVREHEHVDPAGLTSGCDTIFLLSDGAPSWSDYDMVDVTVDWMSAGDPETGAPLASSPTLHYYGPYVEWDLLLLDVERMNLFRKAQLHCLGIGEAQGDMLERLAELGGGQLRTIGGGS